MSTIDLREDQMRLICNGTIMEDDRLISSYGVINGTVMYLDPRLRDGARTRRTAYVDTISFLMNHFSFDSFEPFDGDSDKES